MAVNGSVTFEWGDAEYVFCVAKIKLALELEEKCSSGVAEVFDRLRNDKWRINDVRETLRLGLIGGGLEPVAALKLVTRYCDDRPWIESVQPALLVLMAAMVGVPGDDVGKKPSTEEPSQEKGVDPLSPTTVDSFAPSYMDSAPQPDSPQEIPTS